MRFLFTRFPLESADGGAEAQTSTLMQGLLDHNHAVAFLGSCPTMLEKSRGMNIPTAQLDIGPPPVTKWGAISFLWRKSRMQRQLIAALNEMHDLDAIVMMSLSEKILLTEHALKKGIAVYWLEHDRVGPWLRKNPSLKELQSLSSEVTTIVVSELSKKIYEQLGFAADQIIAIPNGIDTQKLNLSASPMQKPPGLHVGCVARLSQEKGVDNLLQAVAELPGWILSIDGTGPDEGYLRNLAEPLGDQVRFHRRIESLSSFYNSLDVLVLPSRDHDPYGLVAAEAMFHNVPVVVTDACGIAGQLTHGNDALIVPANSAQSLKDALKELEDVTLRKKIAEAGQRKAQQQFTAQKMVERYIDLFAKK